MMTMIAAALAAAPTAPLAPADAHAQHRQMARQAPTADKAGECCCSKTGKEHSGHEMDRTPHHQKPSGQ